jgi:hypothetical protein
VTQGIETYPVPSPSFEYPVTAPDSEANDSPLAVICVSRAWIPYISGAVLQLLLQSTWSGDESTVTLALGRATDVLSAINSQTSVCPEISVIRDIRYNVETDKVQTDFGETGTWIDNPLLDSRHSDVFRIPPRVTDDTRCDASKGMADGFKSFIDAGIHYTQIAQITDAVVGFLLIFLPEVGIFITIIIAAAEALLTAGSDALSTDFTDAVYQEIECVIYCNITSAGTVSGAQKEAIRAGVQATQPTIIYDLFLAYLLLVGEVGLQNSGAKSTATGDCSSCSCDLCHEVDFRLSDGSGDGVTIGTGTYVAGVGVEGVFADVNNQADVEIFWSLGVTLNVSHYDIIYSKGGGAGSQNVNNAYAMLSGVVQVLDATNVIGLNLTKVVTVGGNSDQLIVDINTGGSLNTCTIIAVRVHYAAGGSTLSENCT